MSTFRNRKRAATRLTALLAGVLAFASTAVAQPEVKSPRLCMFDCGYLFNLNPETYNLTRQDVPDPIMSVPCYLVAHPRGV
jgi:hypothetical protein